ncbi:MAG: hypothetical protein ACI93R_003104, partial [Flavobacteriales bacterium]
GENSVKFQVLTKKQKTIEKYVKHFLTYFR